MFRTFRRCVLQVVTALMPTLKIYCMNKFRWARLAPQPAMTSVGDPSRCTTGSRVLVDRVAFKIDVSRGRSRSWTARTHLPRSGESPDRAAFFHVPRIQQFVLKVNNFPTFSLHSSRPRVRWPYDLCCLSSGRLKACDSALRHRLTYSRDIPERCECHK